MVARRAATNVFGLVPLAIRQDVTMLRSPHRRCGVLRGRGADSSASDSSRARAQPCHRPRLSSLRAPPLCSLGRRGQQHQHQQQQPPPPPKSPGGSWGSCGPEKEKLLRFLQKAVSLCAAAAVSTAAVSVEPSAAHPALSPSAHVTSTSSSGDGGGGAKASSSATASASPEQVDIDSLPANVEASLGGKTEVALTETVNTTLIEAWNVVKEAFVDENLNRLDWEKTLTKTISRTLQNGGDEEDAYSSINSMLGMNAQVNIQSTFL